MAISSLFRTRFKIEQDTASWEFFIYYRKWYSLLWTRMVGYKNIRLAYAVAIRKGWQLG